MRNQKGHSVPAAGQTDAARRLRPSGWLLGRRSRMTAVTVAVIVTVTMFFGLLLLNQSRIVQISFRNSEIEQEIRRLTMSNTQRRSEWIAGADLARIRTRALALGLVEPGENQIRRVELPQSDELIVYEGEKRP